MICGMQPLQDTSVFEQTVLDRDFNVLQVNRQNVSSCGMIGMECYAGEQIYFNLFPVPFPYNERPSLQSLDLSTGEHRRIFSVGSFDPKLGFSMTRPLVLDDGSFILPYYEENKNARGSFLHVTAEGEVIWAKKFRCEGMMELSVSGGLLYSALAPLFKKATVTVYKLPPQ